MFAKHKIIRYLLQPVNVLVFCEYSTNITRQLQLQLHWQTVKPSNSWNKNQRIHNCACKIGKRTIFTDRKKSQALMTIGYYIILLSLHSNRITTHLYTTDTGLWVKSLPMHIDPNVNIYSNLYKKIVFNQTENLIRSLVFCCFFQLEKKGIHWDRHCFTTIP